MKVSIIGATGYAGAELVKILLRHPRVEIETITSQSFAGKKISEVYPWLSTDLVCQSLDIERITSLSSFIFTALPHGASMEVVGKLYLRGKKIVDLSATASKMYLRCVLSAPHFRNSFVLERKRQPK